MDYLSVVLKINLTIINNKKPLFEAFFSVLCYICRVMMKLFLKILCCLFLYLNLLSGQVVISYHQDEDAHPSAMLEVASENKGVLFPRMLASERDAIHYPAEGLMVFCTDCGQSGMMQVYTGTIWVDMSIKTASGENFPPTVSNIKLMGNLSIGSKVRAKYDYFDAEDNHESYSIINWFLANDSLGSNRQFIGQNSSVYTIKDEDTTKYIGFSIQPVAVSGSQYGQEVFIEKFAGPVSQHVDCDLDFVISGNSKVGSILSADHDCFYMADSVVYSWYRANNLQGSNISIIQISQRSNYLLSLLDINYFIIAEVQFYQGGIVVSSSSAIYSYPVFSENSCDDIYYTSFLNAGIMIPSNEYQKNNDTIEKYCYNNIEDNCIIYGGLYQWNEAMQYVASSALVPSNIRGICPEGYHLPSDGEFANLEYCIEAEFMPLGSTTLSTFQTSFNSRGTTLGAKMKETIPVWNGENISGFSALPGGRFNAGQFRSIKSQMYLWTATQTSGFYAINRLLLSNSNGMSRQQIHKDSAHSIRCFKD